ncbi:hypothetical protein [Sorangium sp. So ce341]|uniref:hypothetical protein n=1 Tax=Sorangium sp. So ce341 TaxID=3133302 RepID=UPI003F63B708
MTSEPCSRGGVGSYSGQSARGTVGMRPPRWRAERPGCPGSDEIDELEFPDSLPGRAGQFSEYGSARAKIRNGTIAGIVMTAGRRDDPPASGAGHGTTGVHGAGGRLDRVRANR